MKEALRVGKWMIRPSLMSEPSLEVGAYWKAADEEGREG